jgi:hypothetical protein
MKKGPEEIIVRIAIIDLAKEVDLETKTYIPHRRGVEIDNIGTKPRTMGKCIQIIKT